MAEARWEYIQDGAGMVRRGSGERRPVIESLRPSDAVDRLNSLEAKLDAAREALRKIESMTAVAGYDAGHEGVYNFARATLAALESTEEEA